MAGPSATALAAMKVVVYWLTYICSVLLLPRFNTFSHSLLQVYLPSPATKWAVARSTPDDKMVSHRMLGEIQDMHPKYLYRCMYNWLKHFCIVDTQVESTVAAEVNTLKLRQK